MTEAYQGPTPPPELVEQWRAAASNVPASLSTDPGGRRDYIDYIATQAARWGADQELEACVQWVEREIGHGREWGAELRAVRRPKPPSLKKQALHALLHIDQGQHNERCHIIRRALEALPE